MQRGHNLQFNCISCKNVINFSVLNSKEMEKPLSCPNCQKSYTFSNEDLLRKLQKFEALCRQIHESEEILGDTAIAIDINNNQVKVPFRLLLTRLSSVLELKMGEHKVDIIFRIEPLKDVPDTAH
ncbi:MAG: hypothetical protein JHC93_05930 [Parachlamydiales bacterium]|nr:hypothetical protein [Parachlamydiales bacterium]